MRVGYVRVSSVEQNEERQIIELKQKAAELYQESDLISSEWIQAINNIQIQS